VQILTQKALSKAPSPLVAGVYAAVEVCADPVISPDSSVVVPMEGERVSIKVKTVICFIKLLALLVRQYKY
jgi:hypothetical protein